MHTAIVCGTLGVINGLWGDKIRTRAKAVYNGYIRLVLYPIDRIDRGGRYCARAVANNFSKVLRRR